MNSVLVAFHVVVSILIVVVVILQPAAKSSGFGSSFSGSYTTDSAFGAKGPVPFLVKLTYLLAVSVMITSLMLEINIIKGSRSVLDIGLAPLASSRADESAGSRSYVSLLGSGDSVVNSVETTCTNTSR